MTYSRAQADARHRQKRAETTGEKRVTFWLSPEAQVALNTLREGSTADREVNAAILERARK